MAFKLQMQGEKAATPMGHVKAGFRSARLWYLFAGYLGLVTPYHLWPIHQVVLLPGWVHCASPPLRVGPASSFHPVILTSTRPTATGEITPSQRLASRLYAEASPSSPSQCAYSSLPQLAAQGSLSQLAGPGSSWSRPSPQRVAIRYRRGVFGGTMSLCASRVA
ncbi:hypothetical protein VE02_04720 [Pseudogymnoascus sp. 03VT05]|nr:hypothetical protein VE02_04720 [Pseudogymnoascus sp. 03VT05]